MFKENFQHFSKNISDNYALLNLLFIKDVFNIKFFDFQIDKFHNTDVAFEENFVENKKLSMNISNISLKIDNNSEQSFMKEENEGEETEKLKSKFNFGPNMEFKSSLNFNENVLESLISFFKIIFCYSASFLRFSLISQKFFTKLLEKILS